MRVLWRVALVAACLVTPFGLEARQEAPRSPRNASYTIQATLDPVNRLILGTGRLTWRNIANIPATELRFHMYWNAWSDPQSSWLREQSFGRNRALASRPASDRGSIDLTSMSIAGAQTIDLLPGARYIAPDDGNGQDRTVLSVPLPKPVVPGETIAVDLTWNAHVPRAYARTGAIGNYFFIAHWFPKVGVLEDTGWNAHQFHAATEFFSDFGRYDVSLTVPSAWVVGATGRAMSAINGDNNTTTHRFAADDVHDFAWTTSPDFVEVRQRFEDPGLPTVEMRLLLQPEHRAQADRHFAATRAALKFYGTWFGAYPYGYLTIVDPVTIFNPSGQGGSTAGMEYPTLFTGGTRWFTPWRAPTPENVVVHEAGHQFWYGIVATNEFEHGWMDEGLNTYATARVLAEAYPNRFVAAERYFGGLLTWIYSDVAWSRDRDGNRLTTYRLTPNRDASDTPTWRLWPGTANSITYDKTAVWLATLERHLGWATMQRILSTYFSRGAFRHPAPDEFFAIASEVSGQDLQAFFDVVHRSSATIDYAVEQVASFPLDSGSQDSTVVVRRIGDGVLPVDVRVTFDDGAVVVERWSGRDRWQAFRYRRAATPAVVEIDPSRVLLLDVNYTNNSWTSRPAAAQAANSWALRWLTWFEHLLLTYAFFV